MRGQPQRDVGWWMVGLHERWSFSWTVAHSLRWYLETSTRGLTAKRVHSPSELEIGDVILYDFTNDGRIDHSVLVTSVVGGVPYIHAHTSNSADRHYSYSDSTAYTPAMRYYYFKIADVFT